MMLAGDAEGAAGPKPHQRPHPREAASDGKAPRTARGERTLRKILEAAREEFGERGFSDASIVGITSRADVALGTFYTYFDSKDAVFRALVADMSAQVRDHVAPAFRDASDGIDAERRALAAFLEFASSHKQVYRIIDEAEFVDPDGFRAHYETTASRIAARLSEAAERGELSGDLTPDAIDAIAWAVMGANVFLGLRYAVWGTGDPDEIASVMNRLLRDGLSAR
jgi:AcrR family transcriptional regulator